MQHVQVTPKRLTQRLYTQAEIDAAKVEAFREGYGSGADNTQLEHRMRPFLLENEAVEQWLNEH